MPQLAISKIKIDGGTQARAALNEGVVAEYAEAIEAGAKMPAVVVFFDGSAHWLADGFHRFHAHRKAGKESIAAEVRTGTKRDAILHAVGANSDHGLRRTHEDKRRAVRTLLADGEWRKWSDRLIAKACGVGHQLVATVRSSLDENPVTRDRSYTTKHGTQAVMKTAPIAAASAARATPKADAPAKPEAKPEVKAKPKKGAPTIESLQAENAALRDELHEARDVARSLAHELESYETVAAGEKAAAKELTRLKGMLATVEATRDQWMTTAGELRKEVKALQRKLGARQ